ncbi:MULTISPECIES: phosphoenolpyruvate--protein phosphotransferase [unclassified Pseudomonas]|jgi:phosphocarrier protein|uniref:phosphoenolpyruvate--protein phosphotransferase n=1 Tax=unclassified Pseudomonas TaxID=196821 RepID=UPI001F39FA9B|nr:MULTISPECIES: phosphoenolpyruvate--protein phosphotransferase [unclassified Pseudomonas]MCF5506933.1 phosphoenolpyruvate--protein phosphotransferase [Pseudomonas sp. PA-3-6H]MCF5513146.1 phosphoenolpyruvate--protein phosphotransferase [Pseudomonas sp. PA-3-6E]MCF5559998.1 phosphoenolpyruvate--protein phosphotransferase [Pseudomonas sp. PA-3-5D]MCF5568840.1 phosphoenolpyruvate--protein phosphotransferase [Pseudomonas sp. PA-3-11C]MCF5595945.1 phosphoenolpyruvate--protein phosphotransferase [
MPNNNNPLTLSAPLSGPVLALNRVPDEVFASGAMGDGIAIDPLNDCLQAPCDGVIIHVARTGHALTIRADNGAEVLMHVGIDTVELNGEGFALLVKEGARVSEGQPLVQFDLDRIARQCKSLVSLIILTNSERFELQPIAGKTVKVGDALMRIAVRTSAPVNTAVDNSDAQVSATVRITHRGGLHARPAALIRKTAQGFSSQSQLHFGDKTAACDSLIGLMGLGIGEGDEVRVSCRGKDGEAALQALVAALSVAIHEEHHTPVAATPRRANTEANVLQGVCAAPGLVCGPLFRLAGIELPEDTDTHNVDEQLQRLDVALEQVRGEIRNTLELARQRKNVEEEEIFAAHLALLEDPTLLDAASATIEQGSAATHAWRDAIQAQCAVLLALGKPLFAERANDLRDLQQRVLRALLGEAWHFELPAGAIVSAHELTPSDLLQLSAQQAAGICMAEGGATSHVAILARGKGLPCLVALGNEVLDVPQGQRVVLDAANGRLELAPSEARHAEVHQIRETQKLRRQQQQVQARQSANTTDGVTVEVAANVASSAEAQVAFDNGADGVGLLRTEFLFVDRRTAPDEQEQRQAYQAVLDAMGDKSVIIRTIDVGGDKQLDYLPLPVEANPVLGLRGIRMAQVRPELLDQQLRALLQVTPLARCRILLPMVSEVDELLQIRQCLDELCAELELTQRPELGVMIEVPAAALMAEQLAEHADFLSIGTNDLSQYTLAMDRDHAGLAARVDALHPALLRLIAQTCAGAAKHGRWVGVCGALASDPLATPVLVGLGVTELSVSPPQIGEIKDRVRHLDAAQCRQRSLELLDLSSAKAVRQACQHHWPLS